MKKKILTVIFIVIVIPLLSIIYKNQQTKSIKEKYLKRYLSIAISIEKEYLKNYQENKNINLLFTKSTELIKQFKDQDLNYIIDYSLKSGIKNLVINSKKINREKVETLKQYLLPKIFNKFENIKDFNVFIYRNNYNNQLPFYTALLFSNQKYQTSIQNFNYYYTIFIITFLLFAIIFLFSSFKSNFKIKQKKSFKPVTQFQENLENEVNYLPLITKNNNEKIRHYNEIIKTNQEIIISKQVVNIINALISIFFKQTNLENLIKEISTCLNNHIEETQINIFLNNSSNYGKLVQQDYLIPIINQKYIYIEIGKEKRFLQSNVPFYEKINANFILYFPMFQEYLIGIIVFQVNQTNDLSINDKLFYHQISNHLKHYLSFFKHQNEIIIEPNTQVFKQNYFYHLVKCLAKSSSRFKLPPLTTLSFLLELENETTINWLLDFKKTIIIQLLQKLKEHFKNQNLLIAINENSFKEILIAFNQEIISIENINAFLQDTIKTLWTSDDTCTIKTFNYSILPIP